MKETTAYELIQQLAQCPPDTILGASVIAERITPLNSYADGSVDIDEHTYNPSIYIVKSTDGKFRIEVALT